MRVRLVTVFYANRLLYFKAGEARVLRIGYVGEGQGNQYTTGSGVSDGRKTCRLAPDRVHFLHLLFGFEVTPSGLHCQLSDSVGCLWFG